MHAARPKHTGSYGVARFVDGACSPPPRRRRDPRCFVTPPLRLPGARSAHPRSSRPATKHKARAAVYAASRLWLVWRRWHNALRRATTHRLLRCDAHRRSRLLPAAGGEGKKPRGGPRCFVTPPLLLPGALAPPPCLAPRCKHKACAAVEAASPPDDTPTRRRAGVPRRRIGRLTHRSFMARPGRQGGGAPRPPWERRALGCERLAQKAPAGGRVPSSASRRPRGPTPAPQVDAEDRPRAHRMPPRPLDWPERQAGSPPWAQHTTHTTGNPQR